jgi:hypothetical protein
MGSQISREKSGIREYQVYTLIGHIIQVYNDTLLKFRQPQDAAASIFNRIKTYRRFAIDHKLSPNPSNQYFPTHKMVVIVRESYRDLDSQQIWNLSLNLNPDKKVIHLLITTDLTDNPTHDNRRSQSEMSETIDDRTVTLSHSRGASISQNSQRNNQNYLLQSQHRQNRNDSVSSQHRQNRNHSVSSQPRQNRNHSVSSQPRQNRNHLSQSHVSQNYSANSLGQIQSPIIEGTQRPYTANTFPQLDLETDQQLTVRQSGEVAEFDLRPV